MSFMQADTSLDRGQSGLGLGLALVKGLVELHGGEVTAHSDGPGKGSEFTIRLPLNGDQTTAEAAEAIPDIPGCSRRILVIEDIIDVAYMIKSFLEKEGHRVMVAHNGRQGITLARTFHPEVLLCDIGLPGMDGYEVARTFCVDDELKHVFLVSITGYARPKDLRKAKEAGFHCQLAKPVDLTILKQTLAKLSCR